MLEKELLDVIDRVCRSGGAVFVRAGDHLNPQSGYEAKIEVPDPNARDGVRVWRGSSTVGGVSALNAAIQLMRRTGAL